MFPIAISLAPNLRFTDVLIALSYVLLPWRWFCLKKGKWNNRFEKQMKHFFQSDAYTFESGRAALYSILHCLDLKKGDEVLLQGYTCIVVPNSVVWNGLKPVYIDIEEDTFNMNLKETEKHITSKTKAIIIQHTFGKPADIDEILRIAKKHNLTVIEDCAHALGAKYKGQLVGTFGDAAILSFGRDKVISAVHGGAAIINNEQLSQRLKEYRNSLSYVSSIRVLQHCMHSVVCYFFVLPFYNYIIGKVFLVLSQKLKIISKVFLPGEKNAKMPKDFPAQFSNALAEVAFFQWQKISAFNNKRKKISEYYRKELNDLPVKMQKEEKDEENMYMRFSLQTEKAKELFLYAKNRKCILGDWYDTPIAPKNADFQKVFYEKGMCPIAEKVAKKTINLPTYYRLTKKQQKKIVQIIKTFFENH